MIPADLDTAITYARRTEEAGARVLELSVAASHADEASQGALTLERSGDGVKRILSRFREAVDIPLWVKLTGQGGNVTELAKGARDGGADAVTLAGRFMGFVPDVETMRPVLGTHAGFGGPWALLIMCRFLVEARKELGASFPLIGTNGARSGLDVIQMTSAVFAGGFGVLRGSIETVARYLEEQATDASAIIGAAADRVATYAEQEVPVLEARLRRISIGTNPVGTIYFVVGGGIAKLFTKELRVPARAVPHAGSSVYLTLLDRGELTLGLNTSLDSALAYRGHAPYKRALDVEALARVFVMPYGYFVKARSGIETMADLKGKRVVVDLKGNASLAALNWAMLETAGLDKNDITPVAIGGIEQGVAAVTEGRADAAPIAVGIPLLRRAHAGIPGGVRVVALGPQASDDLLNELAPGSRTHRLRTPPLEGLYPRCLC